MRLLCRALRSPWPPRLPPSPFIRSFNSTARLAIVKPFLLSDIGEGIKEVQIIQWFVEPGARVEQFDKLCEVQSDKAAVEITSRFDGVIKKLHYEPEDMARVGKPLCDIDVMSEISPEDEAALASSPEQAGSASSPQQPQKAAEQHQAEGGQPSARDEVASKPSSNNKHSALATPAVRSLLKDLNIPISDVTGSGKDGRILKEDVQKHASSPAAAAAARSTSSPSSAPSPPSSTETTTEHETAISLTPVQSQMFKTMTRSLSIPHFLYADELDITALSRLRTQLNNTSPSPHTTPNEPPQPKLSYLPFIIKALSLALHSYPLLNARIALHSSSSSSSSSSSPSSPQLILRPQHNIGIAMDTPAGLLVPNIKAVHTLSIGAIARELARLRALASAGKLTANDLNGGTCTVTNIGSIGGTYVSPIIAGEGEVAILGVGRRRVVPGFEDEDGDGGGGERMKVVRKEVMSFSWAADHRVVDGATVAKCAEVVKGFVERPERMVVRLR